MNPLRVLGAILVISIVLGTVTLAGFGAHMDEQAPEPPTPTPNGSCDPGPSPQQGARAGQVGASPGGPRMIGPCGETPEVEP